MTFFLVPRARWPGETSDMWQANMTPFILIALRQHPFAPQADEVHGSALVSYNAGTSACGKGEQWQWAVALFRQIWEAKLEPDVIYTTMPGEPRA